MNKQSSPSRTRAVVEIVGVLFIIVLSSFGVGEYLYGSKIDRLEAERDDWKAKYDMLSQKTDGLFAPRLFYEDTLEGSDMIVAHGGEVAFVLQKRFYNQRIVSGSDYGSKIALFYRNEVDRTGDRSLELSSGEQWEYSVGGKRFYIVFDILDPDKPIIVGRIHELNPIYIPAPTSTKGDQTR